MELIRIAAEDIVRELNDNYPSVFIEGNVTTAKIRGKLNSKWTMKGSDQ